MSKLKKCVITCYDETIKNPPFLTIPLDAVDVYKPKIDKGGEIFASRLRETCRSKGYLFKFYSLSKDKKFDYELVVYGQ